MQEREEGALNRITQYLPAELRQPSPGGTGGVDIEPNPAHLNPGYRTLKRQRLLLIISAVVSATLWTYACGDGTTEPPAYFPEPATITVSPATTALTALGATVQLSAEVRDQNGAVMSGATVTWASSDAGAATVNASGLVTAVANGGATITATAGEASGSATVTVAQEASAVSVVPDTATVVEGDTLRLAATATDANGHTVAGAEFAWASGDTAVAVVDATGLVTGIGGRGSGDHGHDPPSEFGDTGDSCPATTPDLGWVNVCRNAAKY